MKVKIIGTKKEYDQACERVYELIHSSESAIDPASNKGEEMGLLSLLIEEYEKKHFSLSAPTPIEAIKFRIDQMDLKQADIAPLLGGKTRVSEILNGRRSLTLKMIVLLNRYLGIPLESLVNGNKEIVLDPQKRKELLNVSSINEFMKTKIAVA
ncbi:MAG: helix-turn-helix domain-containing protein [Cytophagales bacterium]|nr:helix-turn-helix domain-containing protein [Cytophagales bacterium]